MKHREHSHAWPIYGPSENLFTCEFYHGGTIFMDYGKIRYTGCKKDYFDYLDPDEMSLIELSSMVEKLGYYKKTPIWCRARGEKSINPKLLESDQELMTTINKMKEKNRVLECFLDHNESKGLSGLASANLEIENAHDSSAIRNESLTGSKHSGDEGTNVVIVEGEEDSDFYHVITSMPGQELWEKCGFSEVIPSQINPSKPGRPKNKVQKRNNEELENNGGNKISKKRGKVVCSVCHQAGHNKRKHGPRTNCVTDPTIQAQTQPAQQSQAPPTKIDKLPVRRKRESSNVSSKASRRTHI